jgi:hypothetical protein
MRRWRSEYDTGFHFDGMPVLNARLEAPSKKRGSDDLRLLGKRAEQMDVSHFFVGSWRGNPGVSGPYGHGVIDRLLPRSIDNDYRGHKLAFLPFGLLVLLRLVIGMNSIVNGYKVMTNADGIPLGSFPPAAIQALVSVWALLGLSRVVIGLLCVLVLVRYRGLIPVMFVLLLLQHVAGIAITYFLPLVNTRAPDATIVNLTSITLLIVGLGLSLWKRR